MKDIANRLFRILRSHIHRLSFVERFNRLLKTAKNKSYSYGNSYDNRENYFENRNAEENSGFKSDIPAQILEDLAVFELTPPSSLEEVKKARNREIKKFHSDKYINDPEKYKTSKEIMQIYNAAYARLEKYYSQGHKK
ncbi:MAG: hypothetical protein GTO45_41855 [Candidatus Aminicenantes bacterium]|nr:hypothetical protein [Candidatus Aminicenantes bacterium]NIM85157.1 hypothetical protein [Candidatus Aminicenantes bacterium]NIN24667.1 hypothetical protein [Candidatus Aminicenantes bacterium]NIN48428.1 hypothetical protein [Candidatus Aminicenantes bacterium]NIN91331.1 hypothetical protein [Candidatus Aminicenantes bacterium]